MTARNKGLADQQTLVWNAENRLSEARGSNGMGEFNFAAKAAKC